MAMLPPTHRSGTTVAPAGFGEGDARPRCGPRSTLGHASKSTGYLHPTPDATLSTRHPLRGLVELFHRHGAEVASADRR